MVEDKRGILKYKEGSCNDKDYITDNVNCWLRGRGAVMSNSNEFFFQPSFKKIISPNFLCSF